MSNSDREYPFDQTISQPSQRRNDEPMMQPDIQSAPATQTPSPPAATPVAVPPMLDVPTHPVQTKRVIHSTARCPQTVTMRAYEVYCYVYGEQAALVTGGCRGGFGAGELIAFLYAHSFPKSEWRARVDEAFHGMTQLYLGVQS